MLLNTIHNMRCDTVKEKQDKVKDNPNVNLVCPRLTYKLNSKSVNIDNLMHSFTKNNFNGMLYC